MSKNVSTLFKMVAASGFILDSVDDFKDSGNFFNRVKQTGNRFFKECSKLEELSADFVDAEIMSESYEVFGNILEMSLKIDPKKKKSFNREIFETINKYK
jgi:hypothetical protein